MSNSGAAIQQDEFVTAMTAVYEAGYRLHESLDDVDPGYEYAIQQICSELSLMGLLTEDQSVRAMQAAQERRYGEARGEDSRNLAEFGVVIDEQ